MNVAQVSQKLYIEVIAKGGGHTGRAIVRDLHTNVVLVEQDGVATLDKRDTDTAAAGDSDVVSPEQIASFLTVRSIWDYCTKELDPMNDPIDIIRSAVKVNSVISDEGLSKEYGLAIGRNLDLNCRKGLMTRDLTTNSMIAAAAGADAVWQALRCRWWQTPAAAIRASLRRCPSWLLPTGWTSTSPPCCVPSPCRTSSPSASSRSLAV